MSSLVFELQTTVYLGNTDLASRILDVMSALPKRFHPTKAASTYRPAKPFSFSKPQAFLDLVPGETPFNGDAELRKVKRIFAFGLQWSKGDADWFSRHPTRPFNCAGFELGDASIASDTDRFAVLQSVFISLAEEVSATYGYAYVSEPRKSCSPDGFGLCLPRLHWLTYFGTAYSHSLGSALSKDSDLFRVSRHGSGTLLRRNCSAEDAINRSEQEEQAIRMLGREYFWDKGDNWRKPRGDYRVPELDWSLVVAGDGQGANKVLQATAATPRS